MKRPDSRQRAIRGGLLLALLPVAASAARASEIPLAPRQSSVTPIISGMRTLPQPLVVGDDQPLTSFSERHGGDWLARYDRRTGRPILVWGSGLPLVPGAANDLKLPAVPTLADAEQRVRLLLQRWSELHGIDDRDLRINLERSGQFDEGRLWFVDFDRSVGGIPVYGSRIYARLNGGNLVQLGFDRVFPIPVGSLLPALSPAAAVARARAAIGPSPDDVLLDPGTLLLWPVARGEHYDVELVYRVELRRAGDPATWRALVAAGNGEVRELFDANRHTSGRVTGMVFPRTATDVEVERPFGWQRVVVGTEEVVTGWTGNYVAATTDDVLFNLRGVGAPDGGFRVTNWPAGSDAEVIAPAASVVDLRWEGTSVAAGNSTPAERNAFYHLNAARDRALAWIRPSWFSEVVGANVNLGPLCDAFWNGSAVNFFSAGGGCNDAAHVSDVIHHEWGHGLDQNHGGDFDDASGEAIGDITAMLQSRDSVYAPGFLDATRPGLIGPLADFTAQRDAAKLVRGSDIAERCAPSAGCAGPLGYECHCEGLLLSGAAWDLGQLLTARWGEATAFTQLEKLHYVGLPAWLDYRQTFDAWLAVDDDDGNLVNGTPNGCLIHEAFARHEIAGAVTVCSSPHVRLALRGFSIDDTGGDGDGIAEPGETVVVNLEVLNSGNQASSTVTAVLSAGAAGVSIDCPTASFPTILPGGYAPSNAPGIQLTLGAAVACGERLVFELSLRAGSSRYPATIEFEVGKPVALYYTEDFEIGTGGWTGDTGTAVRGQFVAGTPTLTANDGDLYQPGAAAEGLRCLFTGVNSSWDALGTEDVDGGSSRAESPEIAIAGAMRPVLQFDYWFVSARVSAQPNDDFRVFVVVGATATEVFRETLSHDGWRSASIPLADALPVGTSRIRLRFEATDDPGSDNFVEAAIDDIRILDFSCDLVSTCSFGAAVSAAGPSSLCVGESTLLHASVSSCLGLPTYQWFEGGVAIPGATAAEYVVVGGVSPGVRSYEVEVGCASDPGCIVRRGPLVIEVVEADARIAGPTSVEGCFGDRPGFDGGASTVVGCVAGPGYQWTLDGAELAGEIGPTVMMRPDLAAGLHDVGLRVACASNPSCFDLAVPVAVRVIAATAEIAGDEVQFDCVGKGPTLDGSGSRLVGCPGASRYQWSLAGSPIPGAELPTYVVPPLAEGVFRYRLEVACGGGGPACVNAAEVTVVVPSTSIPAVGNSLLGVRAGGSANFVWRASGGLGWHLHRVDLAALLADAWLRAPIATTIAAAAVDPTAPPASGLWFYQVFGVDCTGASVP